MANFYPQKVSGIQKIAISKNWAYLGRFLAFLIDANLRWFLSADLTQKRVHRLLNESKYFDWFLSPEIALHQAYF